MSIFPSFPPCGELLCIHPRGLKDGKEKFYVGFLMRKYNKWAALFGGWFGLHRYLSGEIGMGILYTLTCGGFCIGWIRDIFVSFASRSDAWGQWSDVCGEAAEARKRRALNGELTPVHIEQKQAFSQAPKVDSITPLYPVVPARTSRRGKSPVSICIILL